MTFLHLTILVTTRRLGSKRAGAWTNATLIDELIDALIEREGGYVYHPADKGGATCFGITEAVARAHGYVGAMRELPREEAARSIGGCSGCGRASTRSPSARPRIAAELFDTGANMGPAVATTFLQRALTALNRGGRIIPTWSPTAGSARARWRRSTPFSSARHAGGETVLLRALEALQGERYLRLAERRPANYILDKASCGGDRVRHGRHSCTPLHRPRRRPQAP